MTRKAGKSSVPNTVALRAKRFSEHNHPPKKNIFSFLDFLSFTFPSSYPPFIGKLPAKVDECVEHASF